MNLRNLRLSCVLSLALVLAFNASGADTKPTAYALFERVLELNRTQEPEIDLAAARAAFEKLLGALRTELTPAKTPEQKVAALNKVLLADRNVSYLSNMYWRDASLAASLLRGKGNCLSTSTLYVVAADALKLPVKMVLVPQHAFVRWDDGVQRINIETTAGGRNVPDSDYLQRQTQAAPEDIEKLGWGKSLEADGFIAELLLVNANFRVGERKLEEAAALMEQAEKLSPNRSDIALSRCCLGADISGKRSEARQKVTALLQKGNAPPTVETGALIFLANDAAGQGDHIAERRLLLAAFARAPKPMQGPVLQQLASCHRALKDYRGASRYMELAIALVPQGSPELAGALYNLAIMQKNDKRLADALATIRAAQQLNPESWNLKMIEAGYMFLNGEREPALQKFSQIQQPRGEAEFWDIMVTWFYAVTQQKEKFYPQFEKTLAQSRSTGILEWIDADVDLDIYRKEEQFKAMVEKHGKRLRGN